jgi:hypothetical protein
VKVGLDRDPRRALFGIRIVESSTSFNTMLVVIVRWH